MASAPPTSELSSLFAKKKGKKGKRTVKGLNLNIDSGKPKTEEKPKIAQVQEILGGPDPAEDDGWADVVEKKSVVATGGKQVSDLIDMTTLMTEDETTARKLEKKDIKQAFHDARTVKEPEKEPEPEAKEEKAEATKSRGLSNHIFGGGAARPVVGGWQARMQERELKQREQALSVDNTFAFPSLADAMNGPAKPKPGAGAAPDAIGRRRVGGASASAAILAALGRQVGDEATKASEPAAAAAAPAEGGGTNAPPPPGDADAAAAAAAAAVATVSPPLAAVEETEGEASKTKTSEPVWVAPRAGGAGEGEGAEAGGGGAGETAAVPSPAEVVVPPVVEGGGMVEADKQALVQQFGKKKKKKKKPVEGEQAVGEP